MAPSLGPGFSRWLLVQRSQVLPGAAVSVSLLPNMVCHSEDRAPLSWSWDYRGQGHLRSACERGSKCPHLALAHFVLSESPLRTWGPAGFPAPQDSGQAVGSRA